VSKNFWCSAEIINLTNYFCCNLYCIVIIIINIMLCTVFDFGDCSIYICLLYCIVFICFVCVLCVFSDNFHVQLLYDRIVDLRNYVCVFMYVHVLLPKLVWSLVARFLFLFSAPISSHLTLPFSRRWIPKSIHLLHYKFYLQMHPVSTDFF
jgi:hypothetical protein